MYLSERFCTMNFHCVFCSSFLIERYICKFHFSWIWNKSRRKDEKWKWGKGSFWSHASMSLIGTTSTPDFLNAPIFDLTLCWYLCSVLKQFKTQLMEFSPKNPKYRSNSSTILSNTGTFLRLIITLHSLRSSTLPLHYLLPLPPLFHRFLSDLCPLPLTPSPALPPLPLWPLPPNSSAIINY